MKKFLTMALALTLTVGALAGCTGNGDKGSASGTVSSSASGNVSGSSSAGQTPEELAQLYTDAITAAGGEMVEYNPVVTQMSGEDESAMLLDNMGLKKEDVQAFGISASMMSINAYGIAAVKPQEGKEDAVKQALQGYIDMQKSSFEQYLADQYEIASNAKLEVLKDGTILMVMSEDQDTVFDSIVSAVEKG